jgi:hypothetical protein
MPGETIEAIIRNKNSQMMSKKTLSLLMKEFNKINGKQVPVVGEQKQIPIFVGFLGSDVKDD